MKKTIILLSAVMFSLAAGAQQKSTPVKGKSELSLGLEEAIPVGDFSNISAFGTGVSAKYGYNFTPSCALTFQSGYTYFLGKELALNNKINTTLVPFKAGYRHTFTGGIYVEPQVGYSLIFSKLKGASSGSDDGAFTYAAGLGWRKNSFDIGGRFESATKNGGNYSQAALRLAYTFGL